MERGAEGGFDDGGVLAFDVEEVGEDAADGGEAGVLGALAEHEADGLAEARALVLEFLEGGAPGVDADEMLLGAVDAPGKALAILAELVERFLGAGEIGLGDGERSGGGFERATGVGVAIGEEFLLALVAGGLHGEGGHLLAHGGGAPAVALDGGQKPGALAVDALGLRAFLGLLGAEVVEVLLGLGALLGQRAELVLGAGEFLGERGDGLGLQGEGAGDLGDPGIDGVELLGVVGDLLLGFGDGAPGHVLALLAGLLFVVGGLQAALGPALGGLEFAAPELVLLLAGLERAEDFDGLLALGVEFGELVGEAGEPLDEVVVLVERDDAAEGFVLGVERLEDAGLGGLGLDDAQAALGLGELLAG